MPEEFSEGLFLKEGKEHYGENAKCWKKWGKGLGINQIYREREAVPISGPKR